MCRTVGDSISKKLWFQDTRRSCDIEITAKNDSWSIQRCGDRDFFCTLTGCRNKDFSSSRDHRIRTFIRIGINTSNTGLIVSIQSPVQKNRCAFVGNIRFTVALPLPERANLTQLTLFPRFREPLETDLRDTPFFRHLFTPEQALELGDGFHVGVATREIAKQR